jgi:hypothetical protein
MITAQQFEYQNPADADHTWLESLLFPIVVPEAHLYALVYANVRPSLGVMWNQVMVCGTLTESRSDLLHYNEHHFLPAPPSIISIDSEIGLQITSTDPLRGFRIDYVGEDGTEIHVDWANLMPPFDTHDPAMSPQAGKGGGDMHADPGTSHHESSGHVDMSGRATGTMIVRGRTFAVDSIERMDHSWGPRHPMKVPNMFIVSATFGSDLFFHMICPWNPDKSGPDAIELTHGYVVEDGETYGLTDVARITAQHHGLICTGLQMTVTDVRGKTFSLEATADIGAPWIAGPNAMTHNALMRWSYDGRVGYGVVMKNYSLRYLNERRGRFFDEPTAAVYV